MQKGNGCVVSGKSSRRTQSVLLLCCLTPHRMWRGAAARAAADVSPHNIYRSASGHPLLADFDAAELLDEDGEVAVTGGAGLVGRLAVAAPEVRAAAYGGGGVYGAKSDMWSLGMVLLEMVGEEV